LAISFANQNNMDILQCLLYFLSKIIIDAIVEEEEDYDDGHSYND